LCINLISSASTVACGCGYLFLISISHGFLPGELSFNLFNHFEEPYEKRMDRMRHKETFVDMISHSCMLACNLPELTEEIQTMKKGAKPKTQVKQKPRETISVHA